MEQTIKSVNKFIAVFCTTIALLATWGCSPTNDLGASPRNISVNVQDLGVSRIISGFVTSGAEVFIEVRPYHGTKTGFWGSETSPPFDILWSLRIVVAQEEYVIPAKYLRDLSHILPSPKVKTVEQFISINPMRLQVVQSNQNHEVILNGGDSASGYEVRFLIEQSDTGIKVSREVKYLYDDGQ